MAEGSESVKGLTVKESTIHEEADRILNKTSMGFEPKYNNVSCGCLKDTNPLRRFCIKLVHNAWFEIFIISMILANCVFLALSSPFPLCCTDAELKLDNSVMLKTRFRPTADLDSQTGILKCSADNFVLEMTDIAPGVGPRDDPAKVGRDQVWKKTTKKCCVDLSLDGVKPEVHMGKVVDTPIECADPNLAAASDAAEFIFLAVFTFEMIAKIIAMGFIATKPKLSDGIGGSYLRDPWNWLDFIVVIVAFMSLVPGVGNFSGLRTVRILRPLKTMTAVPGMKTIVNSLLATMGSMVSVIILAVALFTLFGVLGVQLFTGVLEGQCFYLDQSAIDDETGGWLQDDMQGGLCGLDVFPEVNYGPDCRYEGFVKRNYVELQLYNENSTFTEQNPLKTTWDPKCRDSLVTKSSGRTCDDRIYGNTTWSVSTGTMKCLPNGNPNGGWSSFDNVAVGITWIFASITLEGWVDSMYAVGNVWSDKSILLYVVVWLYYTLMIVLCNFVLINLFLAVVADEYTEQELQESEAREKQIQEVIESYQTDGYSIDYDLQRAKKEAKARGDEEQFPEPWGPPIARTLHKLAIHPYFNATITVIIIINTIVMALESHPEDPDLVAFSKTLNYIFTAIFALEMIIKLIGLHPRGYAQDSFNIFDGVVVIISLVEVVMEVAKVEGGSGGLAVLRSFRLVRVFKLARSWKDLQKLLTTIANSLVDVTSAAMLMLLVMFIFCLLGMQFFGGKWTPDAYGGGCEREGNTSVVTCEDGDVANANFDDFGWAFVTVFQVLTGENWNDLLWVGIAAGHYNDGSGVIALLYFVLLNIIGNYVIMNIFLAILLAGFDANDDEEDEGEEPVKKENIKSAKVMPQEKYEMKEDEADKGSENTETQIKKKLMHRASGGEIHDDTQNVIPSSETEGKPVLAGRALFCLGPNNPFRQKVFEFIANPRFDQFILFCILLSSAFLAMDEPWVSVCSCYDGTKDIPVCTEPRSFALQFPSGDVAGNSKGYYQFLVYSDVIVTVIFTFEMAFKIIGLGFVGWEKTEIRLGKFYFCIPGFGGADGKHTYLRNPWNALDFVIVIVAIISIFTGPLATNFSCTASAGGGSILKALRSLRALRALRPLRVIRRYPGLKLVVNSIFKALPQIMNVAMVACLIFLIFAIVGVQFFKGTIAACNDGDIEDQVDCVGNFVVSGADCGMLATDDLITQCLRNGDEGSSFPRLWRSLEPNFDNVGAALVTIFEITSGEMWPDIMYNTIAGVKPGYAMKDNYSRAGPFIYFFLVQVIGAMIMINVFCGVIIDKYNEMKEESEGSALLTNDQKLWVEAMKLAMNGRAVRGWSRPNSGCCGCIPKSVRIQLYNFCMKPEFDYFIMGCIIANTVLMGCRHADMGQAFSDVLYWGNFTFGVIFTVEAIIKIIGLGVAYFSDNWNRFDFTLVILAWIPNILEWLQMKSGLGSTLSLFRVLRVARMFRLLRKNRGLMDLLNTILASIPAMVNVVLLLTLFMFIFSCVAMNLFANIKHGELLNTDANFMTFFMAFNTMWRMSTGESFNGIMHDIRVREPYCDKNVGGVVDPNSGNCGIDSVPQFFFILMFVLLNYVFLNMVMAIVLDNFGDTQALAQCKFQPEHLEDFQEAWQKLDPRGSGYIKDTELEIVLMDVEYPLGLKNIPMEHLHESSLRKYKNRYIHQLNLPHINGKIEYKQTRKALVECVLGPAQELPEKAVVVKDFNRRLSKIDSTTLKNHKGVTRVDNGAIKKCETGNVRVTDLYGLQHIYASKTIQAMFRQYKARLHVVKLKAVAQRLLQEREAANKQQV